MTLLLMLAAGRECAHTTFCRQREMLWGIMQGSGICMGIMHQVSMHEIELAEAKVQTNSRVKCLGADN